MTDTQDAGAGEQPRWKRQDGGHARKTYWLTHPDKGVLGFRTETEREIAYAELSRLGTLEGWVQAAEQQLEQAGDDIGWLMQVISDLESFARTHGYEASPEDIERGKQIRERVALTASPAQPKSVPPAGAAGNGMMRDNEGPAQPTEGTRRWWCEACKREYDTINGGWLCGGHVLRPIKPTEGTRE